MNDSPYPAGETRPGRAQAGVMAGELPRVLLVGENASLKMGGEGSFPYLYFKLLRARGVDVRLACHARVRDELRELLGDDFDRVSFVADDRTDRLLFRAEQYLPAKLREQTFGIARHLRVRERLRPVIRQLVARHDIHVIHEVTPISPKTPTRLSGLGAPVVIGPLCGGMVYPPGFRYRESSLERFVERSGRLLADLLNRLYPGKLLAEAIVVANEQTKRALPRGYRGVLYEGIPDIGVDLGVWDSSRRPREPRAGGPVRFVFLGRLVNWKAVDLLLEAFARVVAACPAAELEILGDGDLRGQLEAQAVELKVRDRVNFVGWVKASEGAARMRDADAFVLPSLRECGGSAVFEAMALGLPVIVARWGGPGIYVSDDCGIRVAPSSREEFVAGLAEAMLRLAGDPELRRRMGEAAIRLATRGIFNWDRKIDRFLEIYREVSSRQAREPHPVVGQ
jgi:glycosyltransferase involved in cell wall biosynthesis